jgi:hypothetical protein
MVGDGACQRDGVRRRSLMKKKGKKEDKKAPKKG